jgi:hypothetical protein
MEVPFETLDEAEKERVSTLLHTIRQSPHPFVWNKYGQTTYRGVHQPFSCIQQLVKLAISKSKAKYYDVPGMSDFLSVIVESNVPLEILSPNFVEIIQSRQKTFPVRSTRVWTRFGSRLNPSVENSEIDRLDLTG